MAGRDRCVFLPHSLPSPSPPRSLALTRRSPPFPCAPPPTLPSPPPSPPPPLPLPADHPAQPVQVDPPRVLRPGPRGEEAPPRAVPLQGRRARGGVGRQGGRRVADEGALGTGGGGAGAVGREAPRCNEATLSHCAPAWVPAFSRLRSVRDIQCTQSRIPRTTSCGTRGK